jgi:predicted enzyme related to lactoylglutathione lyase
MKRVTGIGGVFLKSRDPKALAAWYRNHLGIDVQEWGGAVLPWKSAENPDGSGSTTCSLFAEDTRYFAPSNANFMVNHRVENVRALIAVLRAEGVQVVGEVEETEHGSFGWIMDPEGNKLELWEPPAGQ